MGSNNCLAVVDIRYISEGMTFSCDYKGSTISLRVRSISSGEKPAHAHSATSNENVLAMRLGELSFKETRVYEFNKSSTVVFQGSRDGPAPSTPKPKLAPATPIKAVKTQVLQPPSAVKSFPVTKSS